MQIQQLPIEGKDFIGLQIKDFKLLLFKEPKILISQYQKLLKQKHKYSSETFNILLEQFKDILEGQINQIQETKQEKYSDFLLIHQKKNQNNFENYQKFFFLKQNFFIQLQRNDKLNAVKYENFEKFKLLQEQKYNIFNDLREVFKGCIKQQSYLRQRKQSIEHNIKHFTELYISKDKKLKKLESKALKKLRKKN